MVRDKVVCERWYVTKMVCDKVVCERCSVTKMVRDKVVCERWYVTKMVCDRREAGGGRRPGIQNQKQEPHTKLWGKTNPPANTMLSPRTRKS